MTTTSNDSEVSFNGPSHMWSSPANTVGASQRLFSEADTSGSQAWGHRHENLVGVFIHGNGEFAIASRKPRFASVVCRGAGENDVLTITPDRSETALRRMNLHLKESSSLSYVALLLLFLASVLNQFDRQLINILAEDIKIDFGLSDTQLGLLTGAAFGLFYAGLGIPIGRLVDRFDRIRLLSLMLLVWSTFTLLCGLSYSFLMLFLFRMGVGAGEAGAQPALTSITADIFPKNRTSFALGVLYLGQPLGGSLGLFIGGYIAYEFGWRTTFLLAGMPGILLAIAVLLLMRDPRNRHEAKPGEIFEGSLFAALKVLLKNSAVRWVTLAQACSAFLAYATAAWIPAFFIRTHDMTTTQIGGYAALAVGLAGGFGTFSSAAICDIIRPRISHPESKVLIVLTVLSLPALWITFTSDNLAIAISAMFVLTVSAYAWLAPSARLTQIASGPAHRGLAIACATSTAVILSLVVGLPVVGLISDMLTSAFGPRALGYALLIALCPAIIVCLVSHIRIMKLLGKESFV